MYYYKCISVCNMLQKSWTQSFFLSFILARTQNLCSTSENIGRIEWFVRMIFYNADEEIFNKIFSSLYFVISLRLIIISQKTKTTV